MKHGTPPDAGSSVQASTQLTPAKKRLLEHLKTSGPSTPAELSAVFGHTEVAMRQHLQVLAEEGWVEDRKRPRQGRGRPSREWILTDHSMSLFPDRHDELTLGLITATREAFGQEGLDKILAIRAEHQALSYRQALESKDSLREKAQTLADLRTREGYMAEVVEEEDAILLIEHHCPICDAAKACRNLCSSELALFKEVLGPAIFIERSVHLLQDADRCVYRLTTRNA